MSKANIILYALVAVLVLLSAGGVHALSCELQQTSAVDEGRMEIEISVDLSTPDNQPVKAATVKEYIPGELYKMPRDGVFTRFGLMWNFYSIENKGTNSYILRLPEISVPRTYKLRTVVEYQSYDDLMTLEKISYLTVHPDGLVEIENGEDVISVKRKDKGHNKVYMGVPNFNAYRSTDIVDRVEVIADTSNDNAEEVIEVEDETEEAEEEVEEEAEEAKEVEEADEEAQEVEEAEEDEDSEDEVVAEEEAEAEEEVEEAEEVQEEPEEEAAEEDEGSED